MTQIGGHQLKYLMAPFFFAKSHFLFGIENAGLKHYTPFERSYKKNSNTEIVRNEPRNILVSFATLQNNDLWVIIGILCKFPKHYTPLERSHKKMLEVKIARFDAVNNLGTVTDF